ncbi:hypothetical protein RN001_009104 [Aquatica leii]|uniref:Pre-C2HC domain-containing protein n=1 Tax=Aquatica leii TaxID=1421715 RepID=A0AAN7SMQ9_9COLE|nr:hypothetical protein RN001_009104 [Aquatica leii]
MDANTSTEARKRSKPEDENYRPPKRTVKIDQIATATTNITTPNKFATLTEDSEVPTTAENQTTDHENTKPSSKKRSTHRSSTDNFKVLNINPSTSDTNTTNTATEDAKNTIPIVLRNKAKLENLRQKMNTNKINYTKASTTAQGIRIQPQCTDDYRKLRKLMEAEGHEYHTHSPRQERSLKVVIRGIPVESTEEEIIEDLNRQGYPVFKITRMNGKQKIPAPMVLVELERKYNSIYKLTHVVGLSITTEALRQSGEIIQCHRCQLFGHIQQNCTAEYKCMKCAENHNTHECVKPKTIAAKCSNCGGPHTSTYKNCNERSKFMKHNRKIDAIHIIAWNCNGISNKKQELQTYAHIHKSDIILLNESHSKPQHSLCMKNYMTYRQDRIDRVGGGVAALVKK